MVTLKTSEEGDFESFYPTNVMETAYDILPIWVMRMMIMGIYLTGKSPFKQVYLHGLIRDEKGQKMSKSIGNVINPIDMVEKYGADAVRMALVISSTPGIDKAVGESQFRGMRNFANKIWNAARFVMMQDDSVKGTEDLIFKEKLEHICQKIDIQLESLRIGQAAETVHNEFWHWYCDESIEKGKTGTISKQALKEGLEVFLRLLHPFVPYVTEAVWNELGKQSLLIKEEWPK